MSTPDITPATTPVITRRTKTGVDARCNLCPGVMVLWADRDAHTAWHAEQQTPTPPVPPAPPVPPVPAGYRLLRRYDLTDPTGWTLETGKPSNAEGIDRPTNARFAAGPEGRSLELLTNRDPDGRVFTCDAKATGHPVPNYHRVRYEVEVDPGFGPGLWPALWARPLTGPNREGEIDHWEAFGGNIDRRDASGRLLGWPVHAGTLHTTPYDATHRHVQRRISAIEQPGRRYVLEFELAPGVATWWVDGQQAARLTAAEFDKAVGRPAWEAMFGQASKQWYLRATQQAGGPDGGPISPTLKQWRFWVHDITVYVPAA